MGQAQAHDFLMFVPFPPIILALLDELVVRRRHVVRNGVLLGVVVTAQLLISPEVLSMCALATFGGLVVLVARHPAVARQHARELVVGLGAAAVSFVVLAAYPLWVYLQRAVPCLGAAAPHRRHRGLPHDSGVPDLPQQPGAVRHRRYVRPGQLAGRGNSVEHAVYLGVPLLCILVLIAVRYRRAGIVQFFSLVALGVLGRHPGAVPVRGQGPAPQYPSAL